MPTFVFTDPQGREHEVTGPPGATEAQAFKILQQQQGGGKPAAPEQKFDPTEGMSWGEKALANIGAGIDTTWQGAKQLVGQGMSDEELLEKRKRDKALADATFGGGVIQALGEIAPTIPLGLGAGALAGRGLLGVQAARLAASPVASAAAGGATSGALMPTTEDESKLTNVALGTVAGGAAPVVLKQAGKVLRGVGQLGERAATALPGALGERAAARVAERGTAKVLKGALGDTPIPADVYAPHPHLAAEGVTPSAAVATQDPRLVALERGSRTKAGQEWMDFEQQQQAGRFRALDEGLQKQTDVDSLLSRANEIGAEVEGVYGKAGPKKFNQEMDDFYGLLQTAKTTAEYHGKPAVRSAVDYLENTMRGAGTVTPKLLHLMRQTVSGGLKGVPGISDEGTRAAASEPFVISLKDAMDRVLDKSTKGKFGQWKEDYATQMGKAEGAKADVRIRNQFIDQATGLPKKPVAGLDDVPVITAQALKNAVAAAGSMKRGPRKGKEILAPGSKDLIQGLIRDLDANAVFQRAKATSTAGSGSDTASNMMQALLMETLLPSGLGAARFVMKEGAPKIERARERQLAQLLQDPRRLRQFLAAQEQARLLRGQAPRLPGTATAPLLVGGPGE